MNESLILSSSTSSAVCLSLSRSQLVAALVIGIEWLPDCVAPTFQLMGSGERVFISPKQTHPTASWGLLWRGMWVCVYRGDLSLRFYLQITQMLSFTTSRKLNWLLSIWSLTHNILHVFRCLNSTYMLVSVHSNVLLLSVVYQINIGQSLGQTCCFIQQSDAKPLTTPRWFKTASIRHQFASVTRVKKPWKNRVNVICSCQFPLYGDAFLLDKFIYSKHEHLVLLCMIH